MPDTIIVEDAGHKIEVRPLTAVEKMRIYKVLPPGTEQNMLYLAMVFTACSVRKVDDMPMPWPTTASVFELAIDKIGDSGVEAVQKALAPPPGDGEAEVSVETAAGNLPGGMSSSAALS